MSNVMRPLAFLPCLYVPSFRAHRRYAFFGSA
jgi:hypothetical protein